MKILVTGKNGQLGRSIQNLISNFDHHEFSFVGREEFDLSSSDSISNFFDTHSHFDVIINCAAYNAVDKAEKEIDLADKINHLAVKQMAVIANSHNIKFIHISTDYVFDGKKFSPYLEIDHPNPLNIYGNTKLLGERAIFNTMTRNAIILRTSWVFSEFGNNFVKTMLELGSNRSHISVVSDQFGSPTYAKDLAETILNIISTESFRNNSFPTEIYHLSNSGETSWYEFAKEIFSLINLDCKVISVSSEQYPLSVLRPRNTILNKEKIIEKFKLQIPSWQQSLKECLREIKQSKIDLSN